MVNTKNITQWDKTRVYINGIAVRRYLMKPPFYGKLIQVSIPCQSEASESKSNYHYLFHYDAYGKRKLLESCLNWKYLTKKEKAVTNDAIENFFKYIKQQDKEND